MISRKRKAFIYLASLAIFTDARSQAGSDAAEEYVWTLPKGFPKPRVPADNPMTAAKVALGRFLFYDKRLSANGTQSCATCHKQELAFTDGRAAAVGSTGQLHPRGAMSLVNVAYSGALTWNNPKMSALEDQALVPMFGEHPIELGLPQGGDFPAVLRTDVKYKILFARAFPQDGNPFTVSNVVKALACFERSIISARSPYDRYHYDRDDAAVSESAKRGEILFFSQPLSCFRCHGGFTFSDTAVSDHNSARALEFHNNGLPNADGMFKASTLRNIVVTAPYMHDGSIKTLEEVLDHYAAGGRGPGHDNPNKDPLIAGFSMSKQDRADLVAFLQSLTDEPVLHDPRFSNPW